MPTDSARSSYIREMQVARGIGILLVTFGHSEPVAQVFPATWNLIYSFHMPLFFFMSGFFSVNLVQRDWRREILPSTLRLYIPYIIISASYGIIKLLIPALAKRPVLVAELPVQILFYPFHNPALFLWFLYILLLIRIISPVFRNNRALLLLPISIIVACWYGSVDLFGLWGFLKHLVYFQCGLVLSEYRGRLFKLLSSPWLLVASILLFALAYSTGQEFDRGPVPLVIACLGISVVLSLSFSPLFNFRSSWIEYAGARSLEIYLLQYYFIFPTLFLLSKLSVPPEIIVICSFFAGLAGPLFVYHFILRKNRLLSLLFSGR